MNTSNENTIEFSVKEAFRLIIESENIIFVTGAGISTSAKIPDFRSSNTGMYDLFNNSKLPSPNCLFSFDYFKKNPEDFYNVVFNLYPIIKKAQPTVTHFFIKDLYDKKKLLRHYTQNVDGLDLKTGLPKDKLVEAHGHIRTGTCLNCYSIYSFKELERDIQNQTIPKCKCNAILKPDVILFGEKLPTHFFEYSNIDFKKCDLIIVMGTSLKVPTFEIQLTHAKCPIIYVNNTNIENLRLSNNDIFIKAPCDEFCQQIMSMYNSTNLKKNCDSSEKNMDLNFNGQKNVDYRIEGRNIFKIFEYLKKYSQDNKFYLETDIEQLKLKFQDRLQDIQ